MMKLAETDNVARNRGSVAGSKFSMVLNSKSVEVLIGALYKDRKKAIVRELSTNAVDAHVDAGTTHIPFEVKLPNQFNTEFRIRDFGTGMSKEKIMGDEENGVQGLYNTFFASDKTNSNDAVGCLGLGSKSPLGYVNSFSVTSWYGGYKKVYVVGMGADGIPEVNLFHSESSREPTGIEVSFAVKPEDCAEFERKAREVYKYFKYKPKVTGLNGNFTFDKVEYRIQSDDKSWGIAGDKSIATMGHIAYPIDAAHFETKHDSGNVHANAPNRYQSRNYYGYGQNNYQKLLAAGVHLEFDIGDLEMTPGREDLQYTKQTIDAIKAKLDKVIAEIGVLVSKKFTDAPNLWEARKLYVNLMSGELRPISDMVNIAGATWKGHKLEGTVYLKQRGGQAFDHIPGTEIYRFSTRGYANRVHRDEYVTQVSVPSHNTERFIENDIARGAYVACRRMLLTDKTITNVFLLTFADNAARTKFCETMGFDSSYITKASSLPKEPRQKGVVNREKVFEFARNGHNGKDAWVSKDVEMEDGGVFVEISHYECTGADLPCRMSPANLHSILGHMETLGIKVPTIIGVKTAVVKKFKDYEDAEWVELIPYLRKKLEAYVVQNNLSKIVADIHTYNGFTTAGLYLNVYPGTKKTVEPAVPTSTFNKFVEKLSNLKDNLAKNGNKVKTVLDLSTKLGYNLATAATEDLTKEAEVVLEKYKFLKLVEEYDMNRREKAVIVANLINDVDNAK